MISLDSARWRLALLWLPACGILFLLLVLQSLSGAYGQELQRLWGWVLPNFLPTIALMVSVFAADSLRTETEANLLVRKNFARLSYWLSVFYIVTLYITILAQPFVGPSESGVSKRIELLETSNLWLAPLQGLVVVSLGVLFFLKEDKPPLKT